MSTYVYWGGFACWDVLSTMGTRVSLGTVPRVCRLSIIFEADTDWRLHHPLENMQNHRLRLRTRGRLVYAHSSCSDDMN